MGTCLIAGGRVLQSGAFIVCMWRCITMAQWARRDFSGVARGLSIDVLSSLSSNVILDITIIIDVNKVSTGLNLTGWFVLNYCLMELSGERITFNMQRDDRRGRQAPRLLSLLMALARAHMGGKDTAECVAGMRPALSAAGYIRIWGIFRSLIFSKSCKCPLAHRLCLRCPLPLLLCT